MPRNTSVYSLCKDASASRQDSMSCGLSVKLASNPGDDDGRGDDLAEPHATEGLPPWAAPAAPSLLALRRGALALDVLTVLVDSGPVEGRGRPGESFVRALCRALPGLANLICWSRTRSSRGARLIGLLLCTSRGPPSVGVLECLLLTTECAIQSVISCGSS
mmetsp:Transcript_136062/g.249736  ORF Transcript_136062/g.249736 Transcript_136062/m.249736 type:complete len:162 (+) Transcript_136062:205-690(+)